MGQKQNLTIEFSGDLDLKTDPFQVAPGSFIGYSNAVRTTGKRLTKRNGFENLATFALPYSTSLATFGGGLLGVGNSVQLYSQDTNQIINRGFFQPVNLAVQPAVRTSASQFLCDSVVASNGLTCVIGNDNINGCFYQIIDSFTGNIIQPINTLSVLSSDTARVYVLGTYFVILLYTDSPSSLVPYFINITNPLVLISGFTPVITNLATSYGFEAVVFGNKLYIAAGATDNGSKSFRCNYITSALSYGTQFVVNTPTAPTNVSLVFKTFGSTTIFVFWTSNLGASYTVNEFGFDSATLTPTANNVVYTGAVTTNGGLNIAAVTVGQAVFAYFDQAYNYAFPGGGQTGDILLYSTDPTIVIQPGLLLAGKAFTMPSNFNDINLSMVLAYYPGQYQPTYFLINSSLNLTSGAAYSNIIAKLAYSNAGQQAQNGLAAVTVNGNVAQYSYLYKDTVFALNKGTQTGAVGGIYAQSGINIASFTISPTNTVTSEVGGTLQLSGGFLWEFDGQLPVEQNFHIWPENINVTTDGGGGAGSIGVGTYFYQVTYEWTDAAGNINRSAPSVPFQKSVLAGASTNTIYIPMLHQTAHNSTNPVRIVIYRWSNNNPVYYQITSIPSPIINIKTSSYYTYTDTAADSTIIGNNIIYTNGGVVENIGPPATNILALFDDRMWLVDAEDPNLLWYSKQVIESTPVEMSDLFTFYIAPTTSSQGSTGPTTALAAMDDKLIIYKSNAIYYINGVGPDNTGNNNGYSQPIFITAAVGCSNPKSIVLMPEGLMFQTNQGIWLLGRDLSTKYIGAPVEGYNSYTVTSSISVPNTTQVRFTLSSGVELVYDYYYGKWDTCSPIPAISSVVYQGLHTYLDNSGNIFQETPGVYLDNLASVNMSLTTPWYNLAGLQGYERCYFFYLLGSFISSHQLTVQIAYDYNSTPTQTVVITPSATQPLEQWKIHLARQTCQAIQITITESDSASGAGLTLSGINMVLSIKKSYNPQPGGLSAG